jgi:hypothetical protein
MINTSFNMHEEPIVCTPEDATRAFIDGKLDYLAMGDYLVQHPDQNRFSTGDRTGGARQAIGGIAKRRVD